MNKTQFYSELEKYNLPHSDREIALFDNYYRFLIQENEKYNLTAITNEEDVYEKHFYDSLSILFNHQLEGSICDVGAGAGFPSLPLAIENEKLSVHVLDSTLKRVNFIGEFANQNNIKIEGICARAEEYKEQFDYVTARGVASLNVLLEICCNLVKKDGYLIAMKGSSYKEELEKSKEAIRILGYELVEEQTYTLPSDNSVRCNLFFKKVKNHSPKYPRIYAKIKKSPL